jgi:hypothetical protein
MEVHRNFSSERMQDREFEMTSLIKAKERRNIAYHPRQEKAEGDPNQVL